MRNARAIALAILFACGAPRRDDVVSLDRRHPPIARPAIAIPSFRSW